MDINDGGIGDLPREAMRGLPAPTVRLLSNMCRELYQIGLRVDRAERGALDATTHGNNLWSTIESSLFQFRSNVETQLGQIRDHIEHLADQQNVFRQQLERTTRDQALKLAAMVQSIDAIRTEHQSSEKTVSVIKQQLEEIGERQQSCWSTVHHHNDVINSMQRDHNATRSDTYKTLQDLQQNLTRLEARSQADATNLQRLLTIRQDQHDVLAQKLDLALKDQESYRGQIDMRTKAMIESALEYEKSRRQDEIRMLMDSTDRLQTQQQHHTRTKSETGTDPIVEVMAAVNANAALFAERHEQILDRWDTLTKILRLTQDKVQLLESRLPANLAELYHTVSGECERRLRDAVATGSGGPVRPGGGGELTAAATHTIQTQIDRLHERCCNETRHLRKSMESLCDAISQLSREMDERLRRCEIRDAVDDLDLHIQKLNVTGARSKRATSARNITRQVLHQNPRMRTKSARMSSHRPPQHLSADGIMLQGVGRPSPDSHPRYVDGEETQPHELDEGLDQFTFEHPHIPSYIYRETGTPTVTPVSLRLTTALRRYSKKPTRSARTGTSAANTRTPPAVTSSMPTTPPQAPASEPATERLSGW